MRRASKWPSPEIRQVKMYVAEIADNHACHATRTLRAESSHEVVNEHNHDFDKRS